MKEYKTISRVAGPLVFVKKTEPVAYGDMVKILMQSEEKNAQVLDTSEDVVVVQVFEGTSGIDLNSRVKFLNQPIRLSVSKELLGRIFSGAGKPIDGGPELVPEKKLDISGAAINPYSRANPSDFIQTGVSTIDAMNTLVRGQKLPIFSASGLPHNEIALQIARQAKVVGKESSFAIVFAAMGITNEEAQRFIKDFEETGALERSAVFLNLANDPAVERLLTPQLALTAAEYLAFEKDMHVLVILTDMTNYAESLREIGSAREEIPGRRGYPGYMYTALANIYERAGMIKGKKGSITQLPILTMIGDDITHPIPDLSGYICLSGETEIIKNEGELLPIKSFVENFKKGSILSVNGNPGYYSVSDSQKISTRAKLLELTFRSGVKVKATGDHRFLIDSPQGPKMIEARKIKINDRAFSLKKLDVVKEKRPNILEICANARKNFVFTLRKEFILKIRKKLATGYKDIKSGCRELGISYVRITHPLCILYAKELGQIRNTFDISIKEILKNIEAVSVINGTKTSLRWKKINEDLMYLYGLVFSDGSLNDKAYQVHFNNKNSDLIKAYKNTFKALFPQTALWEHKNQHDVTQLSATSCLITEIAHSLKLTEDWAGLFSLDKRLISAFIAGYFDGDGNCDIKFNRIRYRKKFTNDMDFKRMKRLQQLLKRLGIPSTIRPLNQGKASFGSRLNELTVQSYYAKILSKKILPYVRHQERKILLEELSKKEKFKATHFDKSPTLPPTIGASEKIKNNFILDEIISIKNVDGEPSVYDVTVPKTHNFIVENGIIVSNCEGQIVLSRELHRRNVYPPVDVLPSLSRLMNLGIGAEKTREDHKQASDQMYAFYAEGRDLRGLVAIVGEESLSERDRRLLKFAAEFENRFVKQSKNEERSITSTLDIGWSLLSEIPENELGRISPEMRSKYYGRRKADKK